MAKIIIDGNEVECPDKTTVLQAALDAGWDVPHYCYHPGLTVTASCRLCLMEMKMPHPQTKEMDWAPKLFPSCQTYVRDGLEVRFASQKVEDNRSQCMEYFLLDHPLDCPVCDQAGECKLQDYSEQFGRPTSRMVEVKHKAPKKDVGSKTLLYSDRCVLCTRCIRFCDEIAGTSELGLVNRGNKSEIDIFPGVPLENDIQGNVVDICPVGALLDKDFLMEQRVWYLKRADSICPGCSTGCAIKIDQNDGRVYRLKPRYNPGVNDWWMCDAGRFGWKYIHDDQRLKRLSVRRGEETRPLEWADFTSVINLRFDEIMAEKGAKKIAVVLSPFMSCEEAWLLATYVRSIDPEATLVMGPAPVDGEDTNFPLGGDGPVRFTIRAEKCPNRLGIEMIIASLGGSTLTFDDFVAGSGKNEFGAAWITGGSPVEWVSKELGAAAGKIGTVFAQDLFANKVTEVAEVIIPSCSWAERSGCFVNHSGKLQTFNAAIPAVAGCLRDGHYLYELKGVGGMYNAGRVRDMMAAAMPEFAALQESVGNEVLASTATART